MLESTLEDKEEMNIHVKGWVIRKRKCTNINKYGDKMIRGYIQDDRNLKLA